jgi:N-acetylneuraminic acid mutarotase
MHTKYLKYKKKLLNLKKGGMTSSLSGIVMKWMPGVITPELPLLKNHTATMYKDKMYCFGGYDGRNNQATLFTIDCKSLTTETVYYSGIVLPGRNGHSATLVNDKIFFIGGWRGNLSKADSNIYYLNIPTMTMNKVDIIGDELGPCNMHTADFMKDSEQIFIFVGGDGENYYSRLFCFNVNTNRCRFVDARNAPSPRADHTSAVVGKKLFIFGGWDGNTLINDMHIFDTETMTWSSPQPTGSIPSPRAGCTLTAKKNKLYLFGGSGRGATTYNDVHIYDCETHSWNIPNLETFIPQSRSGHSACFYEQKLFIYGGGHRSNYFNDVYFLDTDPTPEIKVTTSSTTDHLLKKLADFAENIRTKDKFSDITFSVEGEKFYCHKLILSTNSYFARMFSDFKEADATEIELLEMSSYIFYFIVKYIYTGNLDLKDYGSEERYSILSELLRVSKMISIEDLHQVCEMELKEYVSIEKVQDILDLSATVEAFQLEAFCRHFMRVNDILPRAH